MKSYTVSELNLRVKEGLEALFPYPLPVVGEVSNFRLYPSGHAYFSLKDSQSLVSCVMWSSSLARMKEKGVALPRDGDKILIQGKVSAYPARGSYQLVVLAYEPYGAGEALLALEELKKKLAAEGLFAPERKRALPKFPRRIAIIAGSGSAGMKDILVNLAKRWPLAEALPFPSLVQGKEAPKALRLALEKAEEAQPDVLIMGRGGGSSEDLGAFNDEALVRAFAAFPCPTISAVGHEIDTTLVDYAADLRVSTPTGAAVAAVPDKMEIRQGLDEALGHLSASLSSRLKSCRENLEALATRPYFQNPAAIYGEKKAGLAHLAKRLDGAYGLCLAPMKAKCLAAASRLEALSPKALLKKGYALLESEDGHILTSVAQAEEGQTLKAQLQDGSLALKVTAKEEE